MSHTPGPWTFLNEGPREVRLKRDHWSVGEIASRKGVAIVFRDEANARLIAAAPELLEALIHIEEYWNRNQNETATADALWHIIETAQAVIAKATTSTEQGKAL